MKNVITILGAGPAGLTAGLSLAKSGIPVRIVEAEPRLGGLSASVKHKGYIFDYGGHRFYPEGEAIFAMVKEIMGEELKQRRRRSSIFLKGKFIDYPLRSRNLFFNMNTFLLVAAAGEYLLRLLKNKCAPVEEKTLKDWVLNRFGKVLYNIFFRPYSEKFWGIPVDDMTIDWASKRITLVGLWDAIIRLFRKRKLIPATYITTFFYPDHGIGRICERMAEEIIKCGGEVILNSKVVQLEVATDLINGIRLHQEGKETVMRPDYVISTIPITEFTNMIRPSLSQQYLEIARSLRYRALIFVFLMINREEVTDNNWIYFPEKEYIFTRLTEPKNWSREMVPQGKTSLCVEITCQAGDEIWNAKDAEIFARAVRGLQGARLLKSDEIEDYFVIRWKYAYPIYGRNYEENLKRLLTLLSGIRNLTTCGRQGQFNYTTIPDTMKMGLEAADRAKMYVRER